MGIFSSETKEQIAPNRSKREVCWNSRDKYLDCLEKNNIDNPLDDKYAKVLKDKCSKESSNFDQNCAKSWVHYFKEKYVVDLKKERFLKEMEAKGGKELPFPIKRG
ncbi:hypothetical protein WICMUC_003387 [Wickerhamomyces mucosus]|uniref:Cytochrome c oxidase assembly factor 6 n=1 Tax=Wickerhamomyces mucosus TaxID=1378264 RepID=A0A9P8TDA7_9ASCO|nr:hypothetical protein WICMUC_003387 [Wickerhamomyces mucosus]